MHQPDNAFVPTPRALRLVLLLGMVVWLTATVVALIENDVELYVLNHIALGLWALPILLMLGRHCQA